MANRRELKKAIHTVCADLLMECLAVKRSHPSIKDADVENIALSILKMQDDFISRLSHVDKRQVGRFFSQLNDDLSVSTNEVVDHIFSLI